MSPVDFDHLALAAEDQQATVDELARRLGAVDLFGQHSRGFRWMLMRAGRAVGLPLELLEPWRSERDPFLRRFLDRRGPGPHHLTFMTDDLDGLLARLRAHGVEPVDVSLEDPRWREAFVRPADAHGTIVQVAETTSTRPPLAEIVDRRLQGGCEAVRTMGRGWGEDEIWWTPLAAPAAGGWSTLDAVELGVADLERATGLFEDVLGGRRVDGGEGWRTFAWAAPMRMRVVALGRDAGVVGVHGRGPAAQRFELLGMPVEISRVDQ